MNVFLTSAHKALLTKHNLPEPSAWRGLDAATLDALRADVKARLAFWELPKNSIWKWLLGALLTLAVVVGTMFSVETRAAQGYPTQTAEALMGVVFFVYIQAWVVVLVFGYLAFKVLSGVFGHELYWLDTYLAALENNGYRDECTAALRLVRAHKSCEAYRDAVIARGRELTYADLAIMQELSREERRAFRAENSRAQCLELHGLGPASVA